MATGTLEGRRTAETSRIALGVWIGAGSAAVFALAFLGLMIYGVALERGISADLNRLDGRLATLQQVERQLAPLKSASASLHEANALLKSTNGKLDATEKAMLQMKADLRSVTSMRKDLHTMTHKVSHSFLFRGVK